MHLPLYVIFIQISLLASLTLYFQGKTDLYLKLFPIFLLLTGVVEILGTYTSTHKIANTLLYNSFEIIEFCFYLFALMQIVRNKKVRKIILFILPLFLAIALYNMFFGQKNSFNTMTYALGCVLVVATCIYYFLELFQLSHSVNLLRQPAFWICSGLLFFYTCTFPILGAYNILRKAPYIIIANLATIINFLNVFLYSSFTIAFLCRLKTRKSTS